MLRSKFGTIRGKPHTNAFMLKLLSINIAHEHGNLYETKKLKWRKRRKENRKGAHVYLAGALDALPNTKIHDKPSKDETKCEIPFYHAGIIKAVRDCQHFVSEIRQIDKLIKSSFCNF